MKEICSFGCNKIGVYLFKNGKICCSKNQNSCDGVKKKLSESNKLVNSIKLDNSIEKFCSFGCGNKALFEFKNGKVCCSKYLNQCKIIRKKNSQKLKNRVVWNKGLKNCFSKETILKMSIVGNIKKKKNNEQRNEIRKRMIGTHYGKNISDEKRKERKERMLNGQANYMNKIPRNPEKLKKETIRKRESMLNGQAVYLNSFIKNPSKPQIMLFNLVKEIDQSAILNYPLYREKGKRSYSLDVVIPNLKLAIEYGASYWHQNIDRDLQREKDIINKGWKIITYTDYIPSKEKLLKDILDIVSG